MKIAYFCEPQYGGTYTFFKRIRPHLIEHGIDFRCIPPYSAELFHGTEFDNEEGVDYVSFPQDNLAGATRILIEHLDREGYDAVVVLPGSDTLCVNMVRYLPRRIRATARVPMFTRGSYAPASAVADHVDVFFAVCHRIAEDLCERYHVPASIMEVIYNGIAVPSDAVPNEERKGGDAFHMVFTGRLVDSHKGITLLPVITRRLVEKGVDAQLVIVGDGPDATLLRKTIVTTGIEQRVKMVGQVPLSSVQEYLRAADAYVLPTRYEGCPNALLEAMAYECTPVVSRLRGSTDIIVEDGKSGLLAEVGDADSFVTCLHRLSEDRASCAKMGTAARARMAERFSIEKTAAAYAAAFRRLLDAPDRREPALPLRRYSVPRGMKPSWRTRIPDPLKNAVREWLERFGISS